MSDEKSQSWYTQKPRGREWILLLLLCLVVEFLVIRSAYSLPSGTDIVRFVSFTASITSIILAVLAVVYSYYQNFAQRRDSQLVSDQIGRLREIISQVDVSTDTLEEEIQDAAETSAEIRRAVSELREESSQEFENIRENINNFESIKDDVNKQNESTESSNIDLEEFQKEAFFFDLSFTGKLSLFFVDKFGSQLTNHTLYDEGFLFSENVYGEVGEYTLGISISTYWNTVWFLKFLNLSDEEYNLDKQLSSIIKSWSYDVLNGEVTVRKNNRDILQHLKDIESLDTEIRYDVY